MELNFNNILNLVIAIGALVAGLGYAYGQFFSGRNKQEEEDDKKGINTLGYLRGQIVGLQNLVNQLQQEAIARGDKHSKEMKEMNGKMENMAGQLSEKTKQLEEYKAIFQGRDPQLLEMMKQNSESWKQMQEFMGEIKNFIKEMKDNVSMRKTHKGRPNE